MFNACRDAKEPKQNKFWVKKKSETSFVQTNSTKTRFPLAFAARHFSWRVTLLVRLCGNSPI
jgi:hypothetical protein